MPATLPSRRALTVPPFHVMDVLARARALEAEGHDVVHMEVGEPDFPTPAPVLAAAAEALDRRSLGYTPALGLPELRAAVAGFYAACHGVTIPAARVVITPGASGALLLALSALADPGEAVLATDPGYPCVRHVASLLGVTTRAVPLSAAQDFRPDPERLLRAWHPDTRAVIVASPANPTGAVLSAADLAGLADFARARGATLLVDEIYHGLTYAAAPQPATGTAASVVRAGADAAFAESSRRPTPDGPGGRAPAGEPAVDVPGRAPPTAPATIAPTALALDEDVLVVNSFSKYFGMTGWRLGWLIAPESWVPALDRLAQNLFLAAPTPAQYAALAAFRPETLAILEARRREFARRRDALLPALRGLGFGVPYAPAGAFYVYADCSKLPGARSDRFALARRLLDEARVAVTPGQDFGTWRADSHLRFAYTAPVERLLEGVARIAECLGRPASR